MRVLLVEDGRESDELVHRRLESLPELVFERVTTDEVRTAIDAWAPDAILLDLGKDGEPSPSDLAAARECAARAATIVLTSDRQEAFAWQAGLGVHGHIGRGRLDAATLRAALGDAVGRFIEQRPSTRTRAPTVTLFEMAPIGVLRANADFAFTHANPALAAILGFDDASQLLASDVATDVFRDRAERARILAVLRDRGRLDHELSHWRRKDGDGVHVRLTGCPGTSDTGGAELVCTVEDLTERKFIEEQLRQAQKLEIIGRLAAGIAHEINTPIQFVGDSVQFLRQALSDFAPVFGEYRELRAAVVEGRVTPEMARRLEEVEDDADVEFILENTPQAIERSLEGLARVTKIVRSMK
jgi:PAS domain S-box-containing protein